MIELNPAQQAACDFAFGCAEQHPKASLEIATYPYRRGKDGAINWRDDCYVPINIATAVTNRIPAISRSMRSSWRAGCAARSHGFRRRWLSSSRATRRSSETVADLLFGGFPIIGTFAFIDDRDTLHGTSLSRAEPDCSGQHAPGRASCHCRCTTSARCWTARPTSAVCTGQAPPCSIRPWRNPRRHSSTNARQHGLSGASPAISSLWGAVPGRTAGTRQGHAICGRPRQTVVSICLATTYRRFCESR